MKKLLLFAALSAFYFGNAQFNESAPWMESLNLNKRSTQVKFQDIVDSFNTYWSDKDPNVKGSGYKPFKRWEAYWENFVDSNGYLPTTEEFWKSYNQTEDNFSLRSTTPDESNLIRSNCTGFVS